MSRKMVGFFVLAVFAISFLAPCAEATQLFEPFLEVYGTVRPTWRVPRGRSAGQAESQLNRIFLNIDKEFADGKFGFHTDTRYQQEGYGTYPNEFWLEEGYFYFQPEFGKIKLGKISTPFGFEWDHTFYGSILYYKGFKADPDYGLTFERTEPLTVFGKETDLKWTLGYFIREDDLNGETVIGAGFEHLSGGERNTFVFRLNPTIKIGDNSSLKLGLSALTGEIEASESDRQAAVELDAVYNVGPLTLCGEYVFYDRAYSSKDDTLKGECFQIEANLDVYEDPDSKFLKKISLNYNYSRDNPDDGQTLGQIHLPSVTFKFTDFLKTEILYVDWSQDGVTADRSWWMICCVDF